jgi:sugar lactone lactonase YvrE
VAGFLIGVLVAGCGAPAGSAAGLAPLADPTGQPAETLARTFAPGKPVPSVVPIPALSAYLTGPGGLAVDGHGNLFVSQCASGHSVIDRIDPDGQLTRFAGSGPLDFAGDGGPALLAAIACPTGLAFGPDGALYVADHANNRVRRIDGSGIITTVAGSGPAGVNQGSFSGDGGLAIDATLQEPCDVAFDGNGNLYIADRDNLRVRMVDSNGVITTVAGDGHRKFAGDGGPAVNASLALPLGVAVDRAGRLLIADSGAFRVRGVDLKGVIDTAAGVGSWVSSGDGGLATAAEIGSPSTLAFDADGALLVATGDRVRRIDTNGVITTVVGGGGGRPLLDGILATDAGFGEIDGIALDAAGNLYVADGYKGVFKVDQAGVLTLVAGERP